MKKIYGLIGYPLSHSFSKQYFTDKFEKEGFDDCAFINLEFPDIHSLPSLLADHPGLIGFGITIPHKETILPLLCKMDETVSLVGACNCVKLIGDKLYGYNTDITGFERSLTPLLKEHHKKALILGRGGAAKAVSFVLDKLFIDYLFVERNRKGINSISYDDVSRKILHDHHLIINTTPLGMYPNVETYPAIPYEAISPLHYLFDLTYNPEKTLFLQKGEEMGAVTKNGYEMLVIQAEENWRIWNTTTFNIQHST